MKQNPYWAFVENDLARFFTQLDTNPASKTFGSFDRQYWHLKRVDFSSASLQQGCLVLALLYTQNFHQSRFYKNADILKLLEGALRFTVSLAHRDGSMDEWYPQERGWAGPTGYVLYAVVRALQLTETELPASLVHEIRIFAEKATRHLLRYEERDVLSNHQAMALLAIEISHHQFKLKVDEKYYRRRWDIFISNFSREGWSLEYDGCDAGYQSATLSFLSRLYRFKESISVSQLCLKQLDFLRAFIFPDYSFAGSMGSRGTSNMFHFGFEFWAPKNELALQMADYGLKGLRQKTILTPNDQEDHYYIYRLVEFMECAEIFKERSTECAWSAAKTRSYFPEGGIFILNNPDFYGIFNLKKGGTGKVFDLKNNKMALIDSGYLIKTSNGKCRTTAFIQNDCSIEVNETSLTVSKNTSDYLRPVFNPFSFVLFRAFLLFVRQARVSYVLKAWIRNKTMTRFSSQSSIRFTRKIDWSSGLKITDRFESQNFSPDKIYRSQNSPSRFVPQSLYWPLGNFGQLGFKEIDSEVVSQLAQTKTVEIQVL